ncbi:MAG: LemA family protein [Candidatus Micrarchaeota archaeon]
MGFGFEALAGLAAALVAIGLLLYFVLVFNSLIALRNEVRRAWANVDVLLKQRNDELPNLVATVKGYMKHERKLLEGIANARAAMLGAKSLGEKAKADEQLSGALKTLFAVAENYPVLRASENFKQLQDRISGLENEIADRREFYNSSVANFNIRIQSIPDVAVARLLSLKQEEMFAAGEKEKEVPQTRL